SPSEASDEPTSPLHTPCLEANTRLLSAKKSANLKSVLLEFASIKKHGLPLNHQTYNIVLEAIATFRREGSPLTCMLRVHDEMQQANIQRTHCTFVLLIRALCRRDVEVQKTVAMLRRQSARTGQHLKDIDVLETEGNLIRAMDLFHVAMEAGHTPAFEVDLFNQLLRVLSHYGDTNHATTVFHQLEASPNAMSNAATFAALINLFGRAGDIQAARRYFATYQERKATLGPHDASYVYNALVDSHLKCSLLDGALRVIEQDMVNDEIKLTIIPYNSIVRHYCTALDMSKAHAVIHQLLDNPDHLPQPDASTYGPILAAYCHLQDLDGARAVYADLVKLDIAKSYGNLANYALLCLAKEDGLSALAVVEDMRHARLEPDPLLACRIIDHFTRHRQCDQATDAIHTILGVLSPRTLVKGQRLLLDTTMRLMNTLSTLDDLARVALVASPLWSGSRLPLPLALALVDHMIHLFKTETLDTTLSGLACPSLATYSLLFEAVLLAQLSHDTSLSLCLSLLSSSKTHPLILPSYLICRITSFWQKTDNNQSLATSDSSLPEPAAMRSSFDQVVHQELSQKVLDAALQGQYSQVIVHLDNLLTQHRLPQPEAMRDAIAHVGKQGQMDLALRMYDGCLQAYQDHPQQQDTDEKDRATHAIYEITNSLLVGYAQMGDMTKAKVYYDRIKQLGMFPDSNGYASLLLGSAKCASDEASDALTIYDEAKRHHVKPTTFFYNVILSKLAKARKLELALTLFEEMRPLHVCPNAITYGAIISACVRAGAEGHARRLFAEMLSAPSYQPRVGPFNNMMQFYVRQHPSRESVLDYFAEMRRRHIKPSPHTYKLLIEAYSTMMPYDMPTAHRMLGEMTRRDHIRPQATHFAALIYAYGTLQRDVQSADRVYDEMLKLNLSPDEAVYQAMLDTLISNDHMDRAQLLYRDMVCSIDKTSSPYIENLFIRGYGCQGQLDCAQAIFDAMLDLANPEAKSVADWIQGIVVVREPSTYEAMVKAYQDNHQPDRAKAILQQMLDRDFPEKVVAVVADLV
ncbi:TPR-like protein, partial [Hesseltinella vesiculosa]